MSRTRVAAAEPGTVSRALARDRLGVPAVLFFVLAGVAPLTVAAGVIPTAYATTGLTGIPAAFVAIAVILAVFAAGYVAMTRHITNSGAFYAFIVPAASAGSPGWPPRWSRCWPTRCLQVGLYGALGPAAQAEAAAHLGVHAPWWAWALAAWAIITVLGLLRVDITGRVLGVLLTAEIIVIVAETVVGLAHPAGGHLSFATLSPASLTSAGFGHVRGAGRRRRARVRRVRAGAGAGRGGPQRPAHHPGRHLRRAGRDRRGVRRGELGHGRARRHRPRRGRRHGAGPGPAVRPGRRRAVARPRSCCS